MNGLLRKVQLIHIGKVSFLSSGMSAHMTPTELQVKHLQTKTKKNKENRLIRGPQTKTKKNKTKKNKENRLITKCFSLGVSDGSIFFVFFGFVFFGFGLRASDESIFFGFFGFVFFGFGFGLGVEADNLQVRCIVRLLKQTICR